MIDGPQEKLGEWQRTARRLASCSPAHALACRQGFVLTREQARELGMTDPELRRLVRQRSWSAPRRGVVSPLAPSTWPTQLAATALALVRPDTVVSHASAAALWGLPLLKPVERPSVTMRTANGGGQHDANAHKAELRDRDIGRWLGAPVTVVSRTILDVSRTEGRRAGLVAADAALRAGITTPAALRLALLHQRGWPGVGAARWVVEHADGRAESPLESLSRLLMIDAGLPTPDLQAWVDTDVGPFRVDGLWADRRTVFEADGMLKYRRSEDGADPLASEKWRQEAIERAGYRVVRITWIDVHRYPERTIWRIRTALRMGGNPSLLVSTDQFWR